MESTASVNWCHRLTLNQCSIKTLVDMWLMLHHHLSRQSVKCQVLIESVSRVSAESSSKMSIKCGSRCWLRVDQGIDTQQWMPLVHKMPLICSCFCYLLMVAFNIARIRCLIKDCLFLVTMALKESILMKNVLPLKVKTWIMTLYLKTVLKVQTTTGPKGEKYNVIFRYECNN